jgi:molecular chaperone GrpE (heat shock protein)
MAPAPSNKPVGLQIALVAFVLLTLIFGVMAFSFHRSLSDAQAAELKARNELSGVNKARGDADSNVTALKSLVGLKLETVQSNDPNDATTVVGAANRKIGEAGANAGMNLMETLDKLLQSYNATEADRAMVQQRLGELQQQYQQQEERYGAVAAEHDNARRKAEADLRDIVRSRDEALAAKDQEISELRKQWNDAQAEIQNINEQRDKERKKYSDELTRLEGINDKLRDELDELKQQTFEVADGVVRWVEFGTGMVYINLGSADNLRPRTTFSVYAKDSSGIGRGLEQIKGMIEVVKIIDAHTAAAKIRDEDLYRPIAPGDQIYSPLWHPGRVEQFSFVGLIDIDNDGRSDRELLHQVVETAGAKIDNEVDDEGNRTGDGITERTKFLVLGDIPDISQLARPEEEEKAQRIMSHLKDMRREARLNGVRIVNLNDFLGYIGYKPKRRVFQPGQERPYNLTSGSQSTATNEPIQKGSRESSGQVSGFITRDKHTRQQVSPGATSKVFGPNRGY